MWTGITCIHIRFLYARRDVRGLVHLYKRPTSKGRDGKGSGKRRRGSRSKGGKGRGEEVEGVISPTQKFRHGTPCGLGSHKALIWPWWCVIFHQASSAASTATSATSAAAAAAARPKPKPKKFTEQEDRWLAQGVALYGENNWQMILTAYSFAGRTEAELKDRWSQISTVRRR